MTQTQQHTNTHQHTFTLSHQHIHRVTQTGQFANVTVYVQVLTAASKKLNERERNSNVRKSELKRAKERNDGKWEGGEVRESMTERNNEARAA